MNKKILDALSELKIDTVFMEYSGKNDKYIVFGVTKEVETDIYDDENESITYYISLNYWYKKPGDVVYLTKIRKMMKDAGFIFDDGVDLREGNFYGKNYDFIYKEYL